MMKISFLKTVSVIPFVRAVKKSKVHSGKQHDPGNVLIEVDL